jgi:hypothetical protein
MNREQFLDSWHTKNEGRFSLNFFWYSFHTLDQMFKIVWTELKILLCFCDKALFLGGGWQACLYFSSMSTITSHFKPWQYVQLWNETASHVTPTLNPVKVSNPQSCVPNADTFHFLTIWSSKGYCKVLELYSLQSCWMKLNMNCYFKHLRKINYFKKVDENMFTYVRF